MNKSLVAWLACCVAVGLGDLRAQTGTAPPPTAPFVEELPKNSAWKIIVTPKEKARDTPAPAGGAPKGTKPPPVLPVLKEERRVRFEDNMCIVRTWNDNSITQEWRFDGYVLYMQPGLPTVYVFSKSQAMAAVYPVMSNSTFPELSWLTAANYNKVEPYKQRPAYVFQEESEGSQFLPNVPEALRPKAKPGSSSSVKRAWIDRDTKLPLAYDNGTETRTYEYAQPPTTPLVLPANFAAALEKFKRDIASLPHPVSQF